MNGAFADPKLLCGGTDGGPVLYDVKSQAFCPVLHISLQTIHSPPCGGELPQIVRTAQKRPLAGKY